MGALKFQIIGTEQHQRENAMQEFIDKYRDQINGTLSGFDRLVFRGSLRRLNYGCWDANVKAYVSTGMEQYLWQNHILFKDYLDHVKQVSQKVKQASVQPFMEQGLPVEFLRDPAANKDEMARAIATQRGVASGLVCALSSVEPSPSFRTQRHSPGSPDETLPGALSIPDPSASGMDVCADPDLVPVQHSGGTEWAGMASPSNGPAGVEIPATGQLFCLDRRLQRSPETATPAVGEQLGRVAERFRRAVESVARKPLRALSGQLLLDGLPDGMGDRHRVPGGGFPEAADAAAGAARHAQFLQRRRDALLRQASESVGSDSGQL